MPNPHVNPNVNPNPNPSPEPQTPTTPPKAPDINDIELDLGALTPPVAPAEPQKVSIGRSAAAAGAGEAIETPQAARPSGERISISSNPAAAMAGAVVPSEVDLETGEGEHIPDQAIHLGAGYGQPDPVEFPGPSNAEYLEILRKPFQDRTKDEDYLLNTLPADRLRALQIESGNRPAQAAPELEPEQPTRPVEPAPPAQEQPAVAAPVNQHPLFFRPPGFDSLDSVAAPPDAKSSLPDDRIYASKQAQMESALNKAGTRRIGSAQQDVIIGNADVRLEEISLNVERVVDMWREPSSFLRILVSREFPNLDQETMLLDDNVAADVMEKLFNGPNRNIQGLCEKTVNDEATTHLRTVRVHRGAGTWVNTSIAKQFNADFDGDKLKVSFDPEMLIGAKDAIAFLIGTEGDLKIDPDFFAIHPMAGGHEAVKGQLNRMFEEFNPTPDQINGLIIAFETSWKNGAAEAGLKSMVRWARAIATNPGQTQSQAFIVGEILQRIYSMNSEILKTSLIIRGVTDEYGIIPQLEEGEEIETGFLLPVDFPRESAAEQPANMKDAEVALNTPAGTVPGKNPFFRLHAGWAKMGRLSKLILNKDGIINRKTFLDMLALQISGIHDFDESSRAVSEAARKAIFKRVGLPPNTSDAQFVRWLGRFVNAYNDAAFIVNSAAVMVNLDKTLAPTGMFTMEEIPMEPDSIEKKAHTRKQFKAIFGGFRMDVLFGERCPKGYETYTLDEYIYKNKEGLEFLGSKTDKYDSIDTFIGRLADMRTSYAKMIDDELKGTAGRPGALASQMITLPDGRTMTRVGRLLEVREQNIKNNKGPRSLVREMEALIDAFHFLGPEIFDFLGLNNPAGFEISEIGRKFRDADSPDRLLAVLYEAIVMYRFAPIKKLRDLYDQAQSEGDVEMMGTYRDRFDAELKELASSSDTWGAIVRAFESGRRHDEKDVLDYIFFSGRGGAEIERLLNSLVQNDPLGRPEQKLFEIAADMYANPKGMYARNRFMSDFGHKQLLNDLKMASDKIDAFGKVNWSHCVDSVREARGVHEEQENMTKFLQILRKDPRQLVDFQPWMMSDVILSVLEKSYASSEKAQQEAPGLYIYSAVSYLKNAGVWSHMAYGGDFSIGKISIERFWRSPGILVRLLSDPTYSITVYSATGKRTLSMQALLGTKSPTEQQLWNWLEENPRAAMALRRSAQGNGIDRGGKARTTATTSLSDSISTVIKNQTLKSRATDNAVLALADKPGFYALASLTVPMLGKRRFQLRDPMTDRIGDTISFLRGFAKNGLPTKSAVDSVVDRLFLDTFGEKRVDEIDKTYKAALAQPADVQEADDLKFEDDYHLGQIKADLKSSILEYATLLADPKLDIPALPPLSAKQVSELFKLGDPSTIRAYYDVIQTVSNVKTELDTSINGAESRLLLPLMFFAYVTPDPCTAPDPTGIPVLDFSRDWSQWTGRQAKVAADRWIPVNEVTWQEIAALATEQDDLVYIEDPALCDNPVCACKKHATSDQSTNYGNPSTPSFVRLLTIVRTLSAEKLNLKSKTQGDDLTDSIVKNELFDNPLYQEISPKIVKKVNSAYRAAFKKTGGDKVLSMAAARTVLASHLDTVYRSMRYSDELTMDDYINVAQVMIREIPDVSDVPELEVLAMGEISAIVGREIANARNSTPDFKLQDAIDASTRAMSDPELFNGLLEIDDIMAGFYVSRERFMSPGVISQRESSIGRNIELVRQIVAETGVKSVSDETLDKFEIDLLPDFYQSFRKWKKFAGGKPSGWTIGDGTRYTYRVIGVFTTDGNKSILAVGPRNAYIVEAKSSEAVEAIITAYKHGINVLLDGDLTREQWVAIYKKTGLDPNQGTQLKNDYGKKLGTLIPMFDLRLNGFNTTLREGAFNAGAFQARPKGALRYYFESIVNEHSAGEADFVRTKVTNEIEHRRPGEYRVRASVAFSNLVERLRQDDPSEMGGHVQQGRGDIKLVIFGSRGFTDYATMKRVIESTAMYKNGLIAEVISGEAQGADSLGAKWARENGIPVRQMPAKWDDVIDPKTGKKRPGVKNNKYGQPYWPGAGDARNAEMFELATRGIGFWDDVSKGTKNMKYKFSDARKQGIEKDLMLVHTNTGRVEINGEVIGDIASMRDQKIKVRGVPTCEIAAGFDLAWDIIDPYKEGRLSDIHIDLGIPYVEKGSVEDVRFEEDLIRFIARVERGELNEQGWLPTAKPGEIIGFMRAEVEGEVWYHPVRPFEAGNASGAPDQMTILGLGFDQNKSEIVVNWVTEGTMADRYFKIFEDGNASAKYMARAEAIDDIELEDGTKVDGYTSYAANKTRRLLMRRSQKMLTLIYKARTEPWGYNLAESGGLINEPDLRQVVLTGKKSSIALWKNRLKKGPIDFVADEELNELMNSMADRCVRYGIDPTVLFASHHGGVPNYTWFNYQLLFTGSRTFMSGFMRFMHLMNPALCPDGLDDKNDGKTFFDRNLQVLRPVRGEDGEIIGHERVDLFGGWHFLDDHYYGYSASGLRVSTYALPSLPALMAGGKRIQGQLLSQLLDWANIGTEMDAGFPARVRSDTEPDAS